MINKSSRILGIIVLILGFLAISNGMKAQNVIRKGNKFVQVPKDTTNNKTPFTYETTNGEKYPIYLSSSGKAYILMTSKKTGKTYRKYLPKITEQLKEEK